MKFFRTFGILCNPCYTKKRRKRSDIAILFIVRTHCITDTHVYCHTDNEEKNTKKRIAFKSIILKQSMPNLFSTNDTSKQNTKFMFKDTSNLYQ